MHLLWGVDGKGTRRNIVRPGRKLSQWPRADRVGAGTRAAQETLYLRRPRENKGDRGQLSVGLSTQLPPWLRGHSNKAAELGRCPGGGYFSSRKQTWFFFGIPSFFSLSRQETTLVF